MSTWGAVAGALGGAVGLVLGEVVIGWFQGGLIGRAASWAVLGLGIGASQGIAYRSRQRLIFGLIGGGLRGIGRRRYLFEALRQRMGGTGYTVSQGLGMVILGAGLGLFLALVEEVLKRAWVQVVRGRQEGRAYLLARARCSRGLDERATKWASSATRKSRPAGLRQEIEATRGKRLCPAQSCARRDARE